MEGDNALVLDELGRWRMGLRVPASDAEWLAWLAGYVRATGETPCAAEGGAVRLDDVHVEPMRADQPLRAWIGGVYWDAYGQGYPLVRPLTLALTPIAPGDRIEVELYARDARAQNYLIQLVAAITERWPAAGQTVWVHAPQAQAHSLAALKLKTDLSNFALGLAEFTGTYHTERVMAVSFIEPTVPAGQANTPSRKWQRSWTVRLHLPGPAYPYHHIRAFDLALTASRMSGKYALSFTLIRQGHLFSEVADFGRDFAAWCQDNWRAAPLGFEPPTADLAPPPGAMPAGDPWALIPDHLWDRQALRLWWAGLTCVEIGARISQAPKTVRNRLTILRKEYGTDVVPTNRRRRASISQIGTPG